MDSELSAYWLGLDTGTTSSRALLVDANGRVRASFTAPHAEMKMAKPLWAEQDPNDWWHAAKAALHGLLRSSGIAANAIMGIGLTGQMHGLVLLDKDGHVVRPALIWCDQRSQAEVDEINARMTPEAVLKATANPAITGFTLPKLLWVRKHDPEAWAKVRHLLLPKDFIRYKLTGELASDVSDASGTGMFDVANRRWSNAVLDGLEISQSLLPPVHESPAATGEVTAAAARETGLEAGTVVVAGAGDQAASAIGNGIVSPGKVSCTVGTSGVVFAFSERPVYDPKGRVHTFCHAIPGAWHVMGVTQGAGLSLQWFRNRFAPDLEYDSLTAEATLSPPGAHGLFWLPYLMGERTPHLDALARGAWIGLTAKHGRPDLVRSVLEGVCFSLADSLEIIRELGMAPSEVRLSGGGARSPFWTQLFADIFNTPVAILESQEGSAYGAALLAMLGTGEYLNAGVMCEAVIRMVSTRRPEAAGVAAYRQRYRIYGNLYPALKQAYASIGQLAD